MIEFCDFDLFGFVFFYGICLMRCIVLWCWGVGKCVVVWLLMLYELRCVGCELGVVRKGMERVGVDFFVFFFCLVIGMLGVCVLCVRCCLWVFVWVVWDRWFFFCVCWVVLWVVVLVVVGYWFCGGCFVVCLYCGRWCCLLLWVWFLKV